MDQGDDGGHDDDGSEGDDDDGLVAMVMMVVLVMTTLMAECNDENADDEVAKDIATERSFYDHYE